MTTAAPGRAISIVVHADTKVGKSTFSWTSPKPILLLDSEASYRFYPHRDRLVFWDPMRDAPPVYDGTWDMCVVIVREYSIMERAYAWLNSGQHHFRSVVIDSISELQKKCKDDLRGVGEDMDQRKWGALLDRMEWLMRNMRDLTEHPTNPIEAVVITSMTSQRDGKWRPYVQGQLATTMPYFLDIIGYMFVQEMPNPDPTQPGTKMRRLLVSSHPQFEAGERVQGRLPDVVDNPTVGGILDAVFGPVTTQEGTS